MQASITPEIKLHAHAAAFLSAAAVQLVFASAAWCQLPTPPPHLPARPAQPAQALPGAQPTQIQPSQTPAAAQQPASRAYHARVEFANNQLSVSAENSSLDEILRNIANLTGMKITGGVNDERVYGSYGPDSAQVVLNELLDGTGSNVLLLETPQHTLAELILTPRNGGPTPPSPNASRDEERDEESLPPGLSGRRDFPPGGRRDRSEGELFQENRLPEPPQTLPQPAANTGNTPAQPDASQQSPNGVKTPQQIYEELVKQQAQQQQAPTPPPQ